MTVRPNVNRLNANPNDADPAVDQLDQLAHVVEQIGESVIVTTEAVDYLAQHLDTLSRQVEQQHQSIAVLADTVQILAENHQETLARLDQLVAVLRELAVEPVEMDRGESVESELRS